MHVLVGHLPHDSAVAAIIRDGKAHWSVEAYLLDELRMVTVGEKARPHPSRPTSKKQAPVSSERAKKLAAARSRAAARRKAIADGRIT